MDYDLDIPPELDEKFSKLAKKDRKQLEIIDKKKSDRFLKRGFKSLGVCTNQKYK